MDRFSVLTTTAMALLCLGIVLPVREAAAQQSQLVGTWIMVSTVVGEGPGKIEPYGPNPMGTMMLDAGGHFSLQLMRADRLKFASNNRETGTDAENKSAVQGMISYYGTYKIGEADHSMTVHIDGCSFPNWNGIEQKRVYALAGDELQIINPTPSGGGGIAKQIWKRAK